MAKRYDSVDSYVGVKKNGKTAIQFICPICRDGDVTLIVRDPAKTGTAKCTRCNATMESTILSQESMF